MRVIKYGDKEFPLDAEYAGPAIREAIEDGCNDVASQVVDWTDTERSGMDPGEFVIVSEDDGTRMWSGWLGGSRKGEPHWLDPFISDMATASSGQVMLGGGAAIATIATAVLRKLGVDLDGKPKPSVSFAYDEDGGEPPTVTVTFGEGQQEPGETLREKLEALRTWYAEESSNHGQYADKADGVESWRSAGKSAAYARVAGDIAALLGGGQ